MTAQWTQEPDRSVHPRASLSRPAFLIRGSAVTGAQQVPDQFAADFGEGVLAAPTKSGFNLLAWLVPLVGIGGRRATVAAALGNGRREQASIGQVAPDTDPSMLSRIEDEVGKETLTRHQRASGTRESIWPVGASKGGGVER